MHPLEEKYSNMSPYNYVANNPINAIDPDGREIIWMSNFWMSNWGKAFRSLKRNSSTFKELLRPFRGPNT